MRSTILATSSITTAFNITTKRIQARKAYDFKKMYAYVLRCCDFAGCGWTQYSPSDAVQTFR
eukprot:7173389-Prorocentrum_lima.AAC.1